MSHTKIKIYLIKKSQCLKCNDQFIGKGANLLPGHAKFPCTHFDCVFTQFFKNIWEHLSKSSSMKWELIILFA